MNDYVENNFMEGRRLNLMEILLVYIKLYIIFFLRWLQLHWDDNLAMELYKG